MYLVHTQYVLSTGLCLLLSDVTVLLLGLLPGAEPFFSKLFFQRAFFQRVWKSLEKVFGKSLEKSLETGANSEGTCFFGHYMSDAFRALFPRGRSQI